MMSPPPPPPAVLILRTPLCWWVVIWDVDPSKLPWACVYGFVCVKPALFS